MTPAVGELGRALALVVIVPLGLLLVGPLLLLAALRGVLSVGPITLTTLRGGWSGRLATGMVGVVLWAVIWGGLTMLMWPVVQESIVSPTAAPVTAVGSELPEPSGPSAALAGTATPSPAPSDTATTVPTRTADLTATSTRVVKPTNTTSPTPVQATPLAVPSPQRTSTSTLEPTSTPLPTATSTSLPTATSTAAPTPTVSPMPIPTSTPASPTVEMVTSPSPLPPATPTPALPETQTPAPTPLPTATASVSPTVAPTADQKPLATSAVAMANELLRLAIERPTVQRLAALEEYWTGASFSKAQEFALVMNHRVGKPVKASYVYLVPPMVTHEPARNLMLVDATEVWTYQGSVLLYTEAFEFNYTLAPQDGKWVIVEYVYRNAPTPEPPSRYSLRDRLSGSWARPG